MLTHEQIGDYVIIPGGDKWLVRMAGATEYLSAHASKAEAKKAIKRYQAHDKRHS